MLNNEEKRGSRVFFSCLIVLGQRLPHFLHILYKLCLVTITKLLSAHLLGGGEGVKSLSEVKAMLLLQWFRSHVGQVSPTHLRTRPTHSCAYYEYALIAIFQPESAGVYSKKKTTSGYVHAITVGTQVTVRFLDAADFLDVSMSCKWKTWFLQWAWVII